MMGEKGGGRNRSSANRRVGEKVVSSRWEREWSEKKSNVLGLREWKRRRITGQSAVAEAPVGTSAVYSALEIFSNKRQFNILHLPRTHTLGYCLGVLGGSFKIFNSTDCWGAFAFGSVNNKGINFSNRFQLLKRKIQKPTWVHGSHVGRAGRSIGNQGPIRNEGHEKAGVEIPVNHSSENIETSWWARFQCFCSKINRVLQVGTCDFSEGPTSSRAFLPSFKNAPLFPATADAGKWEGIFFWQMHLTILSNTFPLSMHHGACTTVNFQHYHDFCNTWWLESVWQLDWMN